LIEQKKQLNNKISNLKTCYPNHSKQFIFTTCIYFLWSQIYPTSSCYC